MISGAIECPLDSKLTTGLPRAVEIVNPQKTEVFDISLREVEIDNPKQNGILDM